MNHQALQLGFKTFVNLSSSFAARPRVSRTPSFVPLRAKLMGSKRRLSDSSKRPTLPVLNEDNRDDKLKIKGLSETSPNSENAVVKASYQKIGAIEIQSIKDDPAKIEAMTVQELRTMLRNVGVPAKGRKSDLVSALKSFADKQLDGEIAEEEGGNASSIQMENISLKKTAKNVADESCDVTFDAIEFSELKQSKRVKKSCTNNKSFKVDAEIVTTKEKISVNGNEISVTVPQAESWTVLAHKKPQKGWIAYNPRTMRSPPLTENTKSVKLMSWNVNGLRALLKLEGFSALELAQRENFDVLCFQETKLQEKDIESIKECLIEGYDNCFWTCSYSKLGYSGTAIVSRIKPLSVTYGMGIPDHDSEGRLVTAEFDSFYLLCAYVPNSGDGLKRLSYRITQWDPSLSNYMKELEKSKPVILTGDLNCAHQEIDIHNPAGNRRSAGFTDEERHSFGTNFLSRGYVDTFRRQHPNAVGYTYWGYRHGARKTNRGWRLDYFLVSESIADNVHDSYIVPDIMGSDHCPIGLVLKL